MNKSIGANLCILLTAFIWGSAFVAQRTGMDSIGPIYFTALRNYVGFFTVLLVIFIFYKKGTLHSMDKVESPNSNEDINGNKDKSCNKEMGGGRKYAENDNKERGFFTEERKTLIKGGLSCGSILFFAANFQQMGLVTVDAGKCGFLTALYIVIVPILGLFLRKPLHLNHIAGVAFGVSGLYFLCINGSFTIESGDMLTLIGALGWAFQILIVDYFAPKLNPLKLSAAQFLVCAVLSTILALFTEDISLAAVSGAATAILYAGIMSSGVAFTLQIVGQRHANPTTASILMSMEGLFAALCGFLILGEVFTSRELIGCILMMAAVIFAQFSLSDLKQLARRENKG